MKKFLGLSKVTGPITIIAIFGVVAVAATGGFTKIRGLADGLYAEDEEYHDAYDHEMGYEGDEHFVPDEMMVEDHGADGGGDDGGSESSNGKSYADELCDNARESYHMTINV